MLSYLNCPKTILLPNRVFHLIAELLKKNRDYPPGLCLRTGATCHSLISLGISPCNTNDGFTLAALMLLSLVSGSCMYRMLFDLLAAVHVFPHHLGPSIKTAPADSSASSNILSVILG